MNGITTAGRDGAGREVCFLAGSPVCQGSQFFGVGARGVIEEALGGLDATQGGAQQLQRVGRFREGITGGHAEEVGMTRMTKIAPPQAIVPLG